MEKKTESSLDKYLKNKRRRENSRLRKLGWKIIEGVWRSPNELNDIIENEK